MLIETESKAKKLAQALRARIQDGVYNKETPVPTEAQICKEFQVSRSTVREALSILKAENLVACHAGKRTAVLETTPDRKAGYILQQDEHTNAFITTPLVKALAELGWELTLLDPETFAKLPEKLIPDTVFFFQSNYYLDQPWREPLKEILSRRPSAKLIGLLQGDVDMDMTPYFINLDFAAPNKALTARLLEEGHRRFLYITAAGFHMPDPPEPILHGMKAALAERPDIHDATVKIIDEQHRMDELLAKELSRPDRPTAIIASYDHLATTALRTILSLGMSVPEDICLAGQFGTPWSQFSIPPITSTRIDPKTLCDPLKGILSGEGTSFTIPLKSVLRPSTERSGSTIGTHPGTSGNQMENATDL